MGTGSVVHTLQFTLGFWRAVCCCGTGDYDPSDSFNCQVELRYKSGIDVSGVGTQLKVCWPSL